LHAEATEVSPLRNSLDESCSTECNIFFRADGPGGVDGV
jgi:hypothetical protein